MATSRTAVPNYGACKVAGVDEAGRGALAGPVVVAAVVFARRQVIDGCADSKVLSAGRREFLARRIKAEALAWSVERAGLGEIEDYNVLHATLRAMARAVRALAIEPEMVLVDGDRVPDVANRCRAIVGGDARVGVISAASILAKVARDEEMKSLHLSYPRYGFAAHKGYATREHLHALSRYGECAVHRKQWKSVQHYARRRSLC